MIMYDFLRFCVHIFVDLLKRGVLTLAGESIGYSAIRMTVIIVSRVAFTF